MIPLYHVALNYDTLITDSMYSITTLHLIKSNTAQSMCLFLAEKDQCVTATTWTIWPLYDHSLANPI